MSNPGKDALSSLTPQGFVNFVAEKFGSRPAISILLYDGDSKQTRWDSITGNEFRLQTENLISKLKIPGIGRDSRVAILGNISSLWIEAYLAALSVGAMVCPVDDRMTISDVEKVFAHFEPTHLLVSDNYKKDSLNLKRVVGHQTTLITFSELVGLHEFKNLNAEIANGPDNQKNSGNHPTVIYTSGTSGEPKAVLISFKAIMFDCESALSYTDIEADVRSAFSILPLNHLYGLTCGLFYALGYGAEYCSSQSLLPEHVQLVLKEKRVKLMLVVPLFLKMIRNGIYANVRLLPAWKQMVFKTCLAINKRFRSHFLGKLFFGEILKRFGGEVGIVVAGGASLEEKVQSFFEALGWKVFNGYGLTETGPVVTVNSFSFSKPGTVGKPLPGIQIKIVRENSGDRTGEIWVKGPNLFSGYYKAESLSRSVLDREGWFRTGDLGEIDQDGFLSIVGRSKSMIVLSSGKKVQPEEIEAVLIGLDFVKEACVIPISDRVMGEKIVAIVQLVEDPKLTTIDLSNIEFVKEKLKSACENIAPFKRPHEFIFRTDPFPLTSTQKVRRHLVQKEYE